MAPKLAAAGAFVVSLDSMMNIAFPAMATAFALPPESVRWIIICYTGVYARMAFAGGAAADVIGHVRVFRLGIALTTLAFLAGALAPGFGWLLAARVLQGFAGGLIYGTAPGIVTLAGTPPDIVERWHREIVRIVALPDVIERLRTLGFDPVANSPAEFAERIRSEGAKWDRVAKEAKIVLE